MSNTETKTDWCSAGGRAATMTLEQMRALLVGGVRDGQILLRPTNEYNFAELDADTVLDAFDTLTQRIALFEAGLEKSTSIDSVMFQLFVLHCKWRGL